MKAILRNCIYQGKNLFRDFGFLFWTLLYPLILVTFFYTAFLGITNIEYDNINVGLEKDNSVSAFFETIDIVNVIEVKKEEVNEKLEEGFIDGFIDKNLNIAVSDSGMNQTIIKEVLEEIKQRNALNISFEDLDFTVDYIVGGEQEANGILVIFYSLIAMVSAYGIFAGTEIVSLVQGNLTNIGARLNTTSLKKRNFLISGVIVALTLNMLSNGILLLFMKFILKMNLFTEIKYSLIFIILGNLFGISLGLFVGASNKQSVGVKTMISIMIMLFLSFLSGLMSPDIKVMIDKKFPTLDKINPVSAISSNLYRINLLKNTKGIGNGMLLLIFYSILLLLGSYLFLRRQNYDSV